MNRGDLEAADRLLARLSVIAGELGQPFMRWCYATGRAKRCAISGPAEEAERLAFEAKEIGRRRGQPDMDLLFLGQVFTARFLQGALEREDPYLPGLVDRPGSPLLPVGDEVAPNPTVQLIIGAAMSLLLCEVGRLDDAREHFDLVLRGDLPQRMPDYAALLIPVYASVACARLGDASAAARLSEVLEPHSHELISTGTSWFGAVTHYLGLLAATRGRFDEAERRYASLDAKPWLARLRHDRAVHSIR